MKMFDVARLGMFFGRLVKEEDGLAGLKKGLEKFFNSVKDFGYDFHFQAEIKGDKILTVSKCPVHTYFPKWCEHNCIRFLEGFAGVFEEVKVKRISRQPENEFCMFELSKY